MNNPMAPGKLYILDDAGAWASSRMVEPSHREAQQIVLVYLPPLNGLSEELRRRKTLPTLRATALSFSRKRCNDA